MNVYEGKWLDVDGAQVPYEPSVKLPRGVDFSGYVRGLIMAHAGEKYRVKADGEVLHIKPMLAKEYVGPKYTRAIKSRKKKIWKAKMRAPVLIGGMIESAVSPSMPMPSVHHERIDMVYYNTSFALPTEGGAAKIFTGRLCVLVNAKGERKLYDLLDIKEKSVVQKPGLYTATRNKTGASPYHDALYDTIQLLPEKSTPTEEKTDKEFSSLELHKSCTKCNFCCFSLVAKNLFLCVTYWF